jgi:hypothetical protein
MQDRKDLRTGVDGQPQPQDVGVAAQPRPQLVQLEIGKLEVTEKVLMQGLSVQPRAGQPGDDGRLPIAEDPLGGRGVQPFGQSRQDHGDLLRRSFQTVQGSAASSTERGSASLTAKRLDALGLAMPAISHQSVDSNVRDAKVRALRVGTREAVGGYPLRCSSPAFHLTPRTYWRCRWPSTRRESAGEATNGAITWGARLEETVEFGA